MPMQPLVLTFAVWMITGQGSGLGPGQSLGPSS